jgi:hypothetical protein
MGLVERVADVREMRNEYNTLIGKPDANRQLEWQSHRLKDNIKMYVEDSGCEGVDRI